MAILSRFADIMKANVNALLDKAEDPVKMIDQYMRQYKEDFAKVKSETAGVMAAEKKAFDNVERIKKSIFQDEGRLNKARELASAGDAQAEKDAAALEARMETKFSELDDAANAYTAAKEAADHMKQMHDKLAQDIKTLESRAQTMKAKSAVAKATETANKVGGAHHGAAGAKLDAMGSKIDDRLGRAKAMSQLNGAMEDSLGSKYDNIPSGTLDDRLAKLRNGDI